MAIFIIAPEKDEHADWIEWGLKKPGLEVIRWHGLGWQRESSASISFGMRDGVYLADHRVDAKDTVWMRRKSLASHPGVAASEKKYAQAEYRAFSNTLLMNIERTGAFCINKWSAITTIENKSVQLTLARQCGLSIPATVMTNAAPFVKELHDTAAADVVHKSYLGHSWVYGSSGVAYGCETTRLDRDHGFPDEVFAYAPGIYQQKIEKEYDARIMMLGRDFHTFAFTTANKALDWRLSGMFGKLSARRIALPGDVRAGLVRFADASDIVFGCFDMAVDGKGNWWFLEVNQAGQFLGVDWLCPGEGLYQPMLAFLSSREALHGATFPTFRQCMSECAKKDYSVPLTDDAPYFTLQT